ncbi:Eco57I restriction-modification methylase domain-containing protein [Prosthecomicrobium hirschii]|uniref:Eco57I restriction-modification methylase domain-containing protein n=1 Tax=Prosthecodimorpha hirschii TaxID=665126 RepID=UPI001364D65F|nr:type IIL restriction-modification enzyme MmeI [Prosthecomicrobium hirschii]
MRSSAIHPILEETRATERADRLQTLEVLADAAANGTEAAIDRLRRDAMTDLRIDAPDGLAREPFHWPLEFPEVFGDDRDGFDAFIGNPPFSGGKLIGRRFGLSYQEYLNYVRHNAVGAADYCVYFMLRSFYLLRSTGGLGMIATKSISETGSRAVGLDQIIACGGTIYRAFSEIPWPGNAAVVVSVVWISKQPWRGTAILDSTTVRLINGALEEDFELKRPVKLKELKGLFSEGQNIMGRGFELTQAERDEIISRDPKCREVIVPLYNGQDLNSSPVLEPSRWVIYFRDWPEDRARKYGPAFDRLAELVRPYRESLTGQIHQDCFWKFWDLRPSILSEFPKRESVLAIASVTKHVCFARVSTDAVYNTQVKLIFLDGWREFCALQSSLHDVWARWLSGKLGTSTLRYFTSAILETWPMPRAGVRDRFEPLGSRYVSTRQQLMRERSAGLTEIYNQFHNPEDRSDDLEMFRKLHKEMDIAVLDAYGWDDIDLGHSFREVDYLPENDRVRFTISNNARIEVLRRLSELNHQRFEEEVENGLHGKKVRVDARARPCVGEKSTQKSFDLEGTSAHAPESEGNPNRATEAIRTFLEARRTWLSKSDILAYVDIPDGQWNAAINELLASGTVERQGERRGARYRISESD